MTSFLSGALGFILMCFYLNINLKDVAQAHSANPIINLNQTIKAPCNNCVYITKTNKVNKQGSPILKAVVYANGQTQKEYDLLSGRSYTQHLNRNIAGNKSPAPNGKYLIGTKYSSSLYETGYVFLPITPLFITERSDLGFHTDPSWDKDNGENGTSGCLGFKSLKEFNNFVNVISYNKITELIINY
jgi:hypothetical protein